MKYIILFSNMFRNSRRGGMATHAGVAMELGIIRPAGGKIMSPQMEAILIWCQCRVRNYEARKRSSMQLHISLSNPLSKFLRK